MEQPDCTPEPKKAYEPPCILASYEKEELEALMQPEAQCSGCSCGCGGGCP